MFSCEDELFVLSNFTSLFFDKSLKLVYFLFKVEDFFVVFLLWYKVSSVFLVHFWLELCQLFGGFVSLFFILFLKFRKLLSLHWELFFLLFKLLRDLVHGTFFFWELIFEFFKIFGYLFDLFFRFFNNFFIFLVFLSDNISFSF